LDELKNLLGLQRSLILELRVRGVISWIPGRKGTNWFAACMVVMALTESSRRYSGESGENEISQYKLGDATASLSRFRDL
jgi:hypothetical protein